MIIETIFLNKKTRFDLKKPIDISIPLAPNKENPNCYFAPQPMSIPIINDNFIGSVKKGGCVNTNILQINPHGNGTHTECFGHISDEDLSINAALKEYHFTSLLVSIYPTLQENGDRIIGEEALSLLDWNGELNAFSTPLPEALIIRSLPNDDDKLTRNYSGTNPPYFSESFTKTISEHGVKHLLIDLPSVDKEVDGGKLISHKIFWNAVPKIRNEKTITELVYIPSDIRDGYYLLFIGIPPLVNNASPSKPVIFAPL